MKKLKQRSYGTALAALLFSSPLAANPLDITNILGSWLNPVGGANVAITNVASQGQDEIRWGSGTPPDSGYNFTPGADILNILLDTTFLLGTFVHVNEPIPSGTAISSVDYDLSFTTNGIPAGLMTTLVFDHNETPNTADPCFNGGANGVGVNINGCADIVTVASALLNSIINVNGELFSFSLLGFSTDGGTTFGLSFESPEGGSNSAGLYAVVKSVPEPFTILLLGIGLMVLGTQRFCWNRA